MVRAGVVLAALLVASPVLAAERVVQVASFDKVAVGGSLDVEVRVGPAPSVRVIGPAEVLDRVAVEVKDGTLRIGAEKRWYEWMRDDSGLKVVVTAPALSKVALGGSGRVTVDGPRGPSFEGAVAGSGRLTLARVDAAQVKLAVAGSGNVTAAGRCGSGAVEVAGSGVIDAAALRCDRAVAKIAGSGDVRAFSAQPGRAEIAGSGSIRMGGNPACTQSVAGSGSVHCG